MAPSNSKSTFLLLGLLFAVVVLLVSSWRASAEEAAAHTQESVEGTTYYGFGHGHGHGYGYGHGHGFGHGHGHGHHGKPGHGGHPGHGSADEVPEAEIET
ncbi:cold and drought-regulated protein CORA-like [Malania oleifera]|uniref:cold and drought-regulated protein CORA-like n=1 Tax=Malania oleifera TaxID=397392 RepID=UPI0025AE8047|nr:cold and drought-regulated protein CORA-like [Malania oleifera]